MEQLVTREGDLFQVSDAHGDFTPAYLFSGLYSRDTRFLSRFELRVQGGQPLLLAAGASDTARQVVRARATIEAESARCVDIERCRILYGGVLYERITLSNSDPQSTEVQLELCFEADFADLFEVRGRPRPARGERQPVRIEADGLMLGYQGLDQILRQATVHFNVAPAELETDRALWQQRVPGQASVVLDITIIPAENGAFPTPIGYDQAQAALIASYAEWRRAHTVIESDNERVNRVIERSLLDLRALLADRGQGPFLVAGIPWFATLFGRDALIAAIQTLAFAPELARGTLRTLVAVQGREMDAGRLEEPGKIPHELRVGEMANLGEVPFGRYYGSADSTPLFLVLLAEYYAWTGDLALVRELLPAVHAALDWLDRHGDSDGDGFVEYRADPGKGLTVQSWKDSSNSMSHRDGLPAIGPMAVCEVQGYAYDARRRLAPLLAKLGETALAERLLAQAAALKTRFNQAFWMADRQYPAIALDGAKAQVGTVASDAGHCLWSGILDEEHAAQVAYRLLAPDLFSGWGIRTLSTEEVTYDPLSYHNGSVWPHDTSLCVLGLKRHGYDQEANRVVTALFEAATHHAYARLPELFGGNSRDEGPPREYPRACSPQAWAAATPIALVQAMLGLEPDAASGVLRLRPCLPAWIGRLILWGLRVGQAVLDLEATQAGCQVMVREGRLAVFVEQPAARSADPAER